MTVVLLDDLHCSSSQLPSSATLLSLILHTDRDYSLAAVEHRTLLPGEDVARLVGGRAQQAALALSADEEWDRMEAQVALRHARSMQQETAVAVLPMSLRRDEPAMWAVLMAMAVLAAFVSQLVTTPILWFGRSANAKYEDEGLITGEAGEGGAYVACVQVAMLLLQLAMLIQLGEPSGVTAAAGCGTSSWFGHLGGALIMAAILAKLLHLARVGDASGLRVRLSNRQVSRKC